MCDIMLPEVKIYYGNQKYILLGIEGAKRVDPRGTRRKGLCYPTGCVGVGKDGDTVPNTETLKVLSKFYGVSINTLLGCQTAYCQCCGMPLDDSTISKETDGEFNEDYCKWCYTDGEFKYKSVEQLIDFCTEHMASDSCPAEQVRAHMEAVVPNLKHWKN